MREWNLRLIFISLLLGILPPLISQFFEIAEPQTTGKSWKESYKENRVLQKPTTLPSAVLSTLFSEDFRDIPPVLNWRLLLPSSEVGLFLVLSRTEGLLENLKGPLEEMSKMIVAYVKTSIPSFVTVDI